MATKTKIRKMNEEQKAVRRAIVVLNLVRDVGLSEEVAETAVSVLECLADEMAEHGRLVDKVGECGVLDRCNGTLSGSHSVHTKGVRCPLHGRREDGKRMRTYVRQGLRDEVLAAMGVWRQWAKAVETAQGQERRVNGMIFSLKSVGRAQRSFRW